MWHETGHRSEVTCMVQSVHKDTFAVGYADGSVRLWDAGTSTVVVAFNGHTKAVTALAFDDSGSRLATGSQDNELIVWDVLSETGLFRYKMKVSVNWSQRHNERITDCEVTATKSLR